MAGTTESIIAIWRINKTNKSKQMKRQNQTFSIFHFRKKHCAKNVMNKTAHRIISSMKLYLKLSSFFSELITFVYYQRYYLVHEFGTLIIISYEATCNVYQ